MTNCAHYQKLIAVVSLLFTTTAVLAGTIKGHVYDGLTKEQLIGANVVIKQGLKKVVTSLDGGFIFKGLDNGTYELEISYVGYTGVDTTIVMAGNDTREFDIYLFPQGVTLSEVTKSAARDGGSDQYAQKREQLANNIVNIVSSKTIAISPDITVANVMQRISGVSIERSSTGDGQHAIIRGMDKRYNTTLVNGIKIPSPDNRNRYVPLDIFPADLLDRIEVIKSLTPDLEGDATGGVMNLVMRSAPNHFIAEGNVGTGYSQLFLNRDFHSFSKSSVNQKSPAELLGAGGTVALCCKICELLPL